MTLETGFHQPGLWASVYKLLRLQVAISINSFKRARTRKKVGIVIGLVFLLIFLGFIVFVSILLLGFLRSPQLAQSAGIGDFSALLDAFPTLLLTASTAGILLTSFSVLLQGLYLSGDMDFLMSVPISIRAVFIAKLVQAVLPNFLISSLFILPVLYGLGITGGYHFLYYPLVLVFLIALALAAAGLSSLLVMVAARFFPARRVAEVLGFVVGTFFFVFSQSARFMDFEEQQVSSALNLATRSAPVWSPLTWVGKGLVFIGQGNWLPGLGLLAISLALTVGIFYLALTTAEGLYYTGWSSLQNNRRRQKAHPAAKPVQSVRARNPLTGLLPSPVRAILIKDWLVYRRDLRNASQLLTPLILGVVYAIGFLRSGGEAPTGQGEAPAFFIKALDSLFVYGDVALALFLGWMLVANLGGLAFSHEGRNYWMIKTAPLKARTLLAAKFLVAFIPSFVVCGVYILVLQILKGASPWSMLLSLALVAFSLAGLTGIYLFFGVTGAKFDWDTPQQMNGTVGCLGSLTGMIFLPIAFGLYAGPAIVFTLLDFPTIAGQMIGLVLGGGASLAAGLIPLRMVESKVERLNEA